MLLASRRGARGVVVQSGEAGRHRHWHSLGPQRRARSSCLLSLSAAAIAPPAPTTRPPSGGPGHWQPEVRLALAL
eukprot:3939729-Rhodomonas_salina.1